MDVTFIGYKFHVRDVPLQLDDLVWFPIFKEDHKVRLCEVLRALGNNAYPTQLFANWKIHDFFCVADLYPYLDEYDV